MVGASNTTEEIQAFVAECSERLTGYMSDLDRAFLVSDRRDARAELARRATPSPAA